MSNNFLGGHWGQCLELLSHLCEYGNDILVITGPAGIGKSTMQAALSAEFADKFIVCEIDATPTLTTESLAERIELDCSNPANKDLLLLIDDAENLGLDAVALLLQLKQKFSEAGSLHVVLFAAQEFATKMAKSVLKEEFSEQTHTITIEPLTLSEMREFLTHEWRAVHNSELLLSKAKCKKIFNLSGGIPGKAITIAKEVLAGKDGPQDSQKSSVLSPFAVGVTVSFGVLFCVLAIVWPAAENPPVVQQSKTLELATVESTPDAPEEDLLANAVLSNADLTKNEPINPDLVRTADVSDNDKLARLERKLAELQHQLSGEQEARRAAEAKLNHTQISNTTAATKISHSSHEKKLLSMPSQNYAIQLYGTNSESKAQMFISKHKLTAKAYYYKGVHKGKPWYIVVSGNYANRIEAQKAVSKLPSAIRKTHPWPRQYSKIQKSITQHGRHE